MAKGFLVTTQIDNATKIADYPLLNGDLLIESDNGTFTKVCPGLAVCNITLTAEQQATLREVEFESRGLDYRVLSKEA